MVAHWYREARDVHRRRSRNDSAGASPPAARLANVHRRARTSTDEDPFAAARAGDDTGAAPTQVPAAHRADITHSMWQAAKAADEVDGSHTVRRSVEILAQGLRFLHRLYFFLVFATACSSRRMESVSIPLLPHWRHTVSGE